jgi:ribosomal peptide maturation radical SAM protein 1
MDVVLVVMPFADPGRPAIGVSLLKAAAQRAGATARVLYLNLSFAERIGLKTYQRIANGYPPDSLIGEWFFADGLFGDGIPDADRYLVDVLGRYGIAPEDALDLIAARGERETFLQECTRQIMACSPRIVGFSTTFHQTSACLAVARRLKADTEPPLIVFGGANCEGEMGEQLLRSFDCIDYVSTGEADLTFPGFVRDPSPRPGIIGREAPVSDARAAHVSDLDELPIPDYAEYFGALADCGLAIEPELLMETSRGCWWGEKHHCTFCGLNGETMAFRRKSVERVLAEMTALSSRYGVKRVECVDNILDVRFINTVFPALADRELGLDLFFEVKANLRRDQLATLRAGGTSAIQPGIESLSTQVLKLMRKGCTTVQNLQLLRWCEEIGMGVAWNILYGFPDEDPAEYARVAELVPLVTHLPPPAACSPFRLDRFSPLYMQSGAMGLTSVRPARSYYYVFPLGRRDLARLAYYFEFDFADGRDPAEYASAMSREVHTWLRLHERDRPRLDAHWRDGGFDIVDERPCAVAGTHRLEGLEGVLYDACDAAHPPARLTDHGDARAVADAMAGLVARRLAIEADGRFLSLAVMRERPADPEAREAATAQAI